MAWNHLKLQGRKSGATWFSLDHEHCNPNARMQHIE